MLKKEVCIKCKRIILLREVINGGDDMDEIFKMFFGGGIPGMNPGMGMPGGNIHGSSGGFNIPGMPTCPNI